MSKGDRTRLARVVALCVAAGLAGCAGVRGRRDALRMPHSPVVAAARRPLETRAGNQEPRRSADAPAAPPGRVTLASHTEEPHGPPGEASADGRVRIAADSPMTA